MIDCRGAGGLRPVLLRGHPERCPLNEERRFARSYGNDYQYQCMSYFSETESARAYPRIAKSSMR
jgi:hypothetical protein